MIRRALERAGGNRAEAARLLGMTVRLPPHGAERWETSIQPGRTLSVRGVVTASLLGQVMEARAVGTTPEQMTDLPGPRGPGPREARAEQPPQPFRETRDERDRGGVWGAPPQPSPRR